MAARRLDDLPAEILEMVVSSIDNATDLGNFRLLSKYYSPVAERNLFKTITCTPNPKSLEKLEEINSSAKVKPLVRGLKLKIHYLPVFNDARSWEAHCLTFPQFNAAWNRPISGTGRALRSRTPRVPTSFYKEYRLWIRNQKAWENTDAHDLIPEFRDALTGCRHIRSLEISNEPSDPASHSHVRTAGQMISMLLEPSPMLGSKVIDSDMCEAMTKALIGVGNRLDGLVYTDVRLPNLTLLPLNVPGIAGMRSVRFIDLLFGDIYHEEQRTLRLRAHLGLEQMLTSQSIHDNVQTLRLEQFPLCSPYTGLRSFRLRNMSHLRTLILKQANLETARFLEMLHGVADSLETLEINHARLRGPQNLGTWPKFFRAIRMAPCGFSLRNFRITGVLVDFSGQWQVLWEDRESSARLGVPQGSLLKHVMDYMINPRKETDDGTGGGNQAGGDGGDDEDDEDGGAMVDTSIECPLSLDDDINEAREQWKEVSDDTLRFVSEGEADYISTEFPFDRLVPIQVEEEESGEEDDDENDEDDEADEEEDEEEEEEEEEDEEAELEEEGGEEGDKEEESEEEEGDESDEEDE